jgi:putative transposase
VSWKLSRTVLRGGIDGNVGSPLGLKRPESQHTRDDTRLLGHVRTSFAASDETYGARRVWRDLRAWGFACGLHRTERLMGSAGLKARRARRRRPVDGGQRVEHMIANNVLDRQFEAIGPNLKWTADFTYLWTHEGWLFVAVVIDLYSRRVVGWSCSARMTAELVMDALMTAIWRRGTPRSLMHHSDRGSQPIYERTLPSPSERARHRMQHEPIRQLLGQCGR